MSNMKTLDKILEEGYKFIEDYNREGCKIYGKDDLRILYNPNLDLIIIKYSNRLSKKDNGEDLDKSYYINKNLDCDGL